jgi:SOS response regulatory protein OraA/RecX
MKVTQLKALNGRALAYGIFIDGQQIGRFRAEDILEFGLVLNKDISPAVYGRLLERAEYNEYFIRALHYTDSRLRSAAEVKRYLIARGCQLRSADNIVNQLEITGLINETKLAEAYVHDLTMQRPLSSHLLAAKLLRKGIKRTVVETELAKLEPKDEAMALDLSIAKKQNQASYASNQPKLFRYLLNQGFGFEEIAARIGRPGFSGDPGGRRHRTGF